MSGSAADLAGGGAADPGTGGGAAWYASASPEIQGYIQNCGWAADPPEVAALKAVQSAHQAQKFIGMPPEQVVRLPKDATDAEGWKALWQRLGAPADPAGYEFPAGTDADFWRSTAAELNLPKDAAARLAQKTAEHATQTAAAAKADTDAKVAEAKAALAKDWGPNFNAHMNVAKAAAAALGVTPEQINALEGAVGYDKVMNLFRTIGSKIGEDKFVTGSNPGSGGVMTQSQAMDQRRSLMTDGAWVKRYLAGGTAEKREMTQLNSIISGEIPLNV